MDREARSARNDWFIRYVENVNDD